ncbi:hypothetical protein J6590_024183 [Homalodisca vitripennis]|nr:hypothetical protein J6590_024183 [Homalodisca vitripennis]
MIIKQFSQTPVVRVTYKQTSVRVLRNIMQYRWRESGRCQTQSSTQSAPLAHMDCPNPGCRGVSATPSPPHPNTPPLQSRISRNYPLT